MTDSLYLLWIYAVLGVLCIVNGLLGCYFTDNFLPKDFADLTRAKRIMGCLLRISQILVKFMNAILLLVAAGLCNAYFGFDECVSSHLGGGVILLVIMPGIWFV